jgi:hypothetical protein
MKNIQTHKMIAKVKIKAKIQKIQTAKLKYKIITMISRFQTNQINLKEISKTKPIKNKSFQRAKIIQTKLFLSLKIATPTIKRNLTRKTFFCICFFRLAQQMKLS